MASYNHDSYHLKCAWLAVATANWLWGFAIILDIGMMIVSIMAYTGAQSSDDRPTVKDTFITFPRAGHHIQGLEIALPSLGLIANPTLLILCSVSSSDARYKFIRSLAQRLQRRIWQPLVWHLTCLGAWASCVALQASYVPLLGNGKLPECVEFGDELSQCVMVSASWILAMVYCAIHRTGLASVFTALVSLLKLGEAPAPRLPNCRYRLGPEGKEVHMRPCWPEGYVPRSAVIEGPSKVEGPVLGPIKPPYLGLAL